MEQEMNDITKEREINNGANEPFSVTKEGIDYLIQKYLNRRFTEDLDYLERNSGVKFYEGALCTTYDKGLVEADDQKEKRIEEFDSNEAPPEEPIRFCEFFLEALSDKIIIILIICAIIELCIGLIYDERKELGWIEGFTIICAVAIVSLVGSINNYNKEVEFRRIKHESMKERKIFIRRNFEWVEESEENVLVGDIIKIESGMTVCCDSILLEGSAEIDESAMTGEIDPIQKNTYENCLVKRREVQEKYERKGKAIGHAHHDVESPIILSGTQVNSGDGSALVLAVGNNSENGKIRATINANKSSDEGTPLEQKLSDLADKIGLFGLGAAIITSIGMGLNLGIRAAIGSVTSESIQKDPKQVIDIFIIGIVVVVVAIPEGLPLAVTMTLAYSIGKMLKDNNFVRRMESCETMGNAEFVCTDKTGTLTQNKMLMTKLYNFGSQDKNLEETVSDNFTGKPDKYFNNDEWEILKINLACNTNTTFDASGVEKGNKSDESLTKFLAKLGANVKEIRETYMKPMENGDKPQIVFTSARKKMSTIITHNSLPTGHRILLKGASEIIVKACTKIRRPDGSTEDIDKQIASQIQDKIGEYARETLRTFCIAYKDINKDDLNLFYDETFNSKGVKIRPIEESDFTLIAIIGIKDHMKDGVPEAVANCQRAGITVIMITGDNIETAFAIAKNCGIATRREQTILGDDFMTRIGGIVCKTCIEESKQTEKCICPRSKEEWVVKFKQNARKIFKKDNKAKYDAMMSNETEKEKYEAELEEEAFKQYKDQNIKPKIDSIAKIEEFKVIIKDLRVIARSQPQHKYALVTGLREIDHVVSVTGDGTNDAAALSKADVGFAMDAGTDIAKEASDIIIKDNEFKSIVKAIMWGRNVYDNIRKFLQFQLTVNICACVLVMIGASVGQKSPLTAIQMLWVNMIMDSLGSLAIAGEKPHLDLLNRPPNKKSAFIINKKMLKHIIGQSSYQLIVLFIIMFSADRWLLEYDSDLQQVSYDFLKCFPQAPIYHSGSFTKENMYVLSGLETFYSASHLRSNSTECQSNDMFFGDAKNAKEAFNKFISKYFGTSHYTIIFNTFVFMQIFNELCCRMIDDSINFFKRIETNFMFILLVFIEAAVQVVIILFTGPVFNVYKEFGICGNHWGICLAFAALTYPINLILKYIPDPCTKEEGENVYNPINQNQGIVASLRNSKTFAKVASRNM